MMKRILNAGIRLFLLTVVFATSPLLAQKNKPAKIKAAALQVEMIESDEIKLSAEFQVALYENLIRQLEKQGFSHVYRDGDRNAASVADLVVLHSTVRVFGGNLKATYDFAKKAAHVANENFSTPGRE